MTFKFDNAKLKSVKHLSLLGLIFLSINHADIASAQPAKPNIIFIFADDWGWGDLSVHGSEIYKTPNIDKLAAEGTDFYHFSVSSPVCSPSRTSIMTGHFPERSSVRQHFATIEHHQNANMPDWLDPTEPMLPRVLQKAGYTTAHFGKWHLTNVQISDAPPPTEYGYDEFGAFNLPGTNMPPAETADRAIDFIERTVKRDKSSPFFINLWIHETHTPHYPEPNLMKEFDHLPERQMLYAAILAAGDRDVGKVLNTLDEMGISENTIVIFSSDNGPEFSNGIKYMDDDSTGPGFGRWYSVGETQGLPGQKRSLHAGGVRVPFIVRWPGVTPAGSQNHNAILSAVDLFPTLVDIAGGTLPDGYLADGENIRSALSGKAFERNKPIYWIWPSGENAQSTDEPTWPQYGIQSGKWKLLVNEKLSKTALYHVKNDWYEQTDLAMKHPQVVKKLLAELHELRSQMPHAPSAVALSKLRTQITINESKN